MNQKQSSFYTAEGPIWQSGDRVFSLSLPPAVADRSGLQDLTAVEALQDKLIRALRQLLMQNHGEEAATTFTKLLLKLPELRSLNNMHSEELLSFKVHP